jgi:hypothetical protein
LHRRRAHRVGYIADVPVDLVRQERGAVADRGKFEVAVDVLSALLRSVAAECSMIARSARSWV